MSQAIFKYPVEIDDVIHLKLPRHAQPLSVQMQAGQPQLWALVDPDQPAELFLIHCYGTGHPANDLPTDSKFLGTVQLAGGALVFHLFGYFSNREHAPAPLPSTNQKAA